MAERGDWGKREAWKKRSLIPCLTVVLAMGLSGGKSSAQTEAWACAGQSGTATTVDLGGFTSELEHLAAFLAKKPSPEDLGQIRGCLPSYWMVHTDEGTFAIATDKLKRELGDGKSEDAQRWVAHVLAEAKSYSQRNEVDGESAKAAHAELETILAKPEFAAVHPPSAWDLFRERLEAWIERLLLKIFGGLERYPIGGQILFWAVIVAGVAFIALWIVRFLSGRERIDGLRESEIVSASRTWQEWTRLAREAAARNDFRGAVHAAYWAGIARLEDSNVVPKDRAKTPREYLRLVSAAYPERPTASGKTNAASAQPRYREPLTELTSRLERSWYANRGANRDDYEQTLRQLEAMGCQLD